MSFVVSMVTMHLELVICGHVPVICNWLQVCFVSIVMNPM